jgi:ribosomal protein L10
LSLNRSEKEAVVTEVTSLAAKAQTLVMAEYRGITVADMTKLRNDARSKGVQLSVLKNTLARRAVAGSQFEIVGDQMTGPLIYGFSVDAVAAAKVVADFAKTNDKLVIRGGAFAGKAFQGSVAGPALRIADVADLAYCRGAQRPGSETRRWCRSPGRRSNARSSRSLMRGTNPIY